MAECLFLSWCVACIVLLVFCLVTENCQAGLIEVPANDTVRVGGNVILKCRTNGNSPVNWVWLDRHCSSEDCQPKYIVLIGRVTTPFQDRFTIPEASVQGQYDLQVCDVRESDSGTYTCVDEAGISGAQRASAQLLVTTQTVNQLHKMQTSGIVDVTTLATSPSLRDAVIGSVAGIGIAILIATVTVLFIRIRRQRRCNHQINETDKNEIIGTPAVVPHEKESLIHTSKVFMETDVPTSSPSAVESETGLSTSLTQLSESPCDSGLASLTSHQFHSQVSTDSGCSSSSCRTMDAV